MGLDGVELLMRVEASFSIRIEDREAAVRTVGDLYQLVLAKVGRFPKTKCLSACAFRELRAAMQECGLARSSIHLKSQLSKLVPAWRRRAFFRRLARSTGLAMPSLHRPGAVTLASIMLVMVAAAAMSLSLTRDWWVTGWLLLTIPLGFVAAIVTRPLAVQLANCQTVAQLTRAVVAENYARLSQKYQTMNERDTWKTLCHLISDQLAVPEKDLAPETRFVEDLKIG
jgi:hypothetical protein